MTVALRLDPLFRLRAIQEDDAALVFAIFAAGRQAELDLLAWNPAQKEQFLRLQFQAQTQAYRAHYPQADYQLIEWEEQVIGRLLVAEQDAGLFLVDIGLLPQFQGQGLGTALLSGLIAEADVRNLPMHLHVASTNPALRLYQRLGFRIVEQPENAVYLTMFRDCAL